MPELVQHTVVFERPSKIDADSRLTLKLVTQGFYGGLCTLEVNGERPYSWYRKIDKTNIAVSPDGMHIAFAAYDDDGTYVVVDGEESRILEGVCSKLRFSDDSQHISYSARVKNEEGLEFYVVIVDSEVVHTEEYVFGYDAMSQAPGPRFSCHLSPAEESD
jgi:hypothetical protein